LRQAPETIIVAAVIAGFHLYFNFRGIEWADLVTSQVPVQ